MTDCSVQIKFVQQVNDSTCEHACLSMVTGIPIEDLIDRFGSAAAGDEIESIVLTELGILPVPTQTIGGVCEMVRCGVYLMTVPSLNQPGKAHRVVSEATPKEWRIYDPQFGREGRIGYDVDAFNGSTPKLQHWSQAVFLHPMLGHRGNKERLALYRRREADTTQKAEIA